MESARHLAAAFQSGQCKAVETTESFLSRIERLEPRVHAFLDVQSEVALAAARDQDRRRAAGDALGPLAGVPVAVKDLICTQNWKTTCGSRMLESFVPPYDAEVIRRLRAADAILIGKTNLDEFAMGSSTEHSAFGNTRNPWDEARVPGGSSGGAAACVAADMAPLSLGTDTGGSIRQPASFCGVVGLKPTYGRVSRYGLVAFASSLDQIGPLARSAEDTALLLQVLAGHDERDSTSAPRPVDSYLDGLDEDLRGLRVGFIEDHFGEGLDPEVEQGVRSVMEWLESRGARLSPVRLPHARYGIAAYYVIASCEASSNLARYDGVHYTFRSPTAEADLESLYCQSRSEGFGTEVKRRIMLGTFALSSGYYDAYYNRALKVRRLIRDDFLKAFADVDVLLGPTTPTPAFQLAEKADDPLAMYLADIYTVPANLAGLPAISFPCGFSQSGLPLGAQLWAAPFAEARLLQVVHQYQQESDWHLKQPTLS